MISSTPTDGRPKLLVVLALTFIVQFALMSVSFPLSELFTDKPLLYIDNGFHWYQIQVALGLAQSGQAVGYDPFFAAGHFGGITFNLSARFPALAAVLLGPSIDITLLWKLYVFGISLLAPLCLPLAARLLRAGRICISAVALLGLLLWWTCYFRWFFTAGMVTYVAVCYFSVLYAAWMWAYLTGDGRLWSLVALGFAAGALVFFHSTAPVFVVVIIAWLCLLNWTQWHIRRFVEVGIVALIVCVIMNLVWIAPVISSGMYFQDIHTKESFLREIDLNLIWRETLGFDSAILSRSRAYLPITIFALIAATSSFKSSSRQWLAWVAAGFSIAVIRSVGGGIDAIAMMQPYRFSPAAYLLMALPAGHGLEMTIKGIKRAATLGRRWQACGAAILLALCFGYLAREAVVEALPGSHARIGAVPPYVRGVGPRSRWAIAWLKSNTNRSARILFETTRGRFHDGASIAGYVALSADRELIGGPYHENFFAGYWDGFAFGRPLKQLQPAAFNRYLELYNIGWILAFSPISRDYLAKQPSVKLVSESDGFAAYKVDRSFSYFLKGQGQVVGRSYNNLRLTGLAGDEVILKYHFLPGLTSMPPSNIQPVFFDDDPIPFIRILKPAADITLLIKGFAPAYDAETQTQVKSRAKPLR
jgi:hypothetical protein